MHSSSTGTHRHSTSEFYWIMIKCVCVCVCVINSVYQLASSSAETRKQEIKSFDRKYSRESEQSTRARAYPFAMPWVLQFCPAPVAFFFIITPVFCMVSFEDTCPIIKCLVLEGGMKTSLINVNCCANITCMKTIRNVSPL